MDNLAFMLFDNRSGSTMLAALLNQYRGITVSVELPFVPQVLECRNDPLSVADQGVVLRALNEQAGRGLLLQDHARLRCCVEENPTRKTLLHALLKLYFETNGGADGVWVVKAPRLHYHIGVLRVMFPHARVIHVVRDGRAVYHSKARTLSSSGRVMEDNLLNAARTWCWKLSVAEQYASKEGTVRYEDVVLDPDLELNRLLDHLRVYGSDRDKVKSQQLYIARIPADHKHAHENVGKPPQSKYGTTWQSVFDRTDLRVFESIAGGALARYGYPIKDPGGGAVGASLRLRTRTFVWWMRYVRSRVRFVVRLVRDPGYMWRTVRRRRRRSRVHGDSF